MTEICEEFDVKIHAIGILAGGFLSQKCIGAPEQSIKKLLNFDVFTVLIII